jgi:hypothetical protein
MTCIKKTTRVNQKSKNYSIINMKDRNGSTFAFSAGKINLNI